MNQNLWNAMKMMLGDKFIALNVYFYVRKKMKIRELIHIFRHLGKKKQQKTFFLKDKETKIIEFNKHKNQNYIQEGPWYQKLVLRKDQWIWQIPGMVYEEKWESTNRRY